MKGDLLNYVSEIFHNGCFPQEVMKSLVVFIPKGQHYGESFSISSYQLMCGSV